MASCRLMRNTRSGSSLIAAGAVVAPHGQPFSVMAFTVTGGKITQIDALADPGRLAQLDLTFPDASP
jgi:hypothetical protein